MGTDKIIARLRERLTERAEHARLHRASGVAAPNGEMGAPTEWTRGYWTGAMDGYTTALAALDAIEASENASC